MLGTTFGGSPLACAAGLAVLEVMENEKLMDNTTTVGNYLLEQCMSLSNIKEVRGKGLMIGLEFDFPIKDLRNQLLQEYHIFVGNSKYVHTLRLLPSLTIGKTEVDIFMDKLKKCIK